MGDMTPRPHDSPESQPRFLADAMLGRLARWLRVLGFDTHYNPMQDDHELVRLADRERRVLLTRDRHLVEHLRPDQGLLLQEEKPLAQLQEVIERCRPPRPAALFTRCLRCNRELVAATAEQRRRVPARAQDLPGPVLYCPACERLYWSGSHTRRMRNRLAATLQLWPQDRQPETR